jgi:hypothetical protein
MPDHRLAEQFRKLCEQAAKETDPKKLLELTQAINRIFGEREKANRDLARRAPRGLTMPIIPSNFRGGDGCSVLSQPGQPVSIAAMKRRLDYERR